ncbi:hypothetical protein V865_007373 [Kwoniella europaea PYCC6329]|uniref:Nucleolus and neural progenitor protein-like N-terminal domain-containing protein n=1 Tax=Kwoniella europaea PYCC6329 TaxID=1423913 RepID=A0AAX4KS08_9TREE
MSSPISTPSSGGPSNPLNRLHVHPSIASHLSTELSFLQTLLLRARDQHRTQLFLRRMHEVLRIGRILLKYVRETSSVHTDESGWETRRLTGERLIYRMVKSLFTAQRFTSQIIELHHFLPLQASVLAIYSRLFTMSMNIASGLGMDIDSVIQHGGQLKHQKKKKLMNVDVDEQGDRIGEVVLNDTRNGNEMGIHGIELGERIQRPSITPRLQENSPLTSRRQSPVSKSNNRQFNGTSPQIEQPTGLSSRSQSPLISAQPELREDDGYNPSRLSDTTISVNVPDDNDPTKDGRKEDIPKKQKKRSHDLDLDLIFDTISSHAQSPRVKEKGLPQHSNEPQKKKKIEISGVDEKLEKPKKKKKKKKDAMDDIFGF